MHRLSPDLTNPKNIIERLKQGNLRTKRHLGQHFLISRKILEQIIKAARLSPAETVLEIGPGLGVLTIELAKRVRRVVAVEKDKPLLELLQINLRAEGLKNVEVIHKDILRVTSNELPVCGYKIVANLPYQVTSPFLWKFLHEFEHKPRSLTLMIQREVAERILAKPGQMSLLSVLVQFYGLVRLVAKVRSSQFWPPPRVASAVVQIDWQPPPRIDEQRLFRIVKTGFSNKRKKIKNNLVSQGFQPEELAAALAELGLDSNIRAQALSVADWLKLYQVLYNE